MAVSVLLICSILIKGLASAPLNDLVSEVTGELDAFELETTTFVVTETFPSEESVKTSVVAPETVKLTSAAKVISVKVI